MLRFKNLYFIKQAYPFMCKPSNIFPGYFIFIYIIYSYMKFTICKIRIIKSELDNCILFSKKKKN